MPFPSGRPARYGNVRPTDYAPCIGTVPDRSCIAASLGVDLRFAVRSCLPFPYRHPWRPPLSSARRPCTRNSSSIIPGQRKRPWRFKPGTHPAKTLRRHRAAASQFKLHRQRKTSSHFKRSTLEHLLTFRRTCDRSTSDKVMFRRL